MSKRVIFWITGIIMLPILCFALYTWAALTWSYSKGERAGYVQKLGKKGWICKTWEGEMALVTMPGTVAEKFYFTVRDEVLAQQINKGVGKRLAIVYEQHKGIPNSCFGETEYFATEVKVLD
ncbi:MAG: hypothetical protein PHN75_02455 [Syntrophales bacterium]|nr:hypothetical protein [Syntrophales bacterium]